MAIYGDKVAGEGLIVVIEGNINKWKKIWFSDGRGIKAVVTFRLPTGRKDLFY